MQVDRFVLQQVHYMPKQLEAGILYLSHEFETAAHLCACGCGAKIRTPLGPTEWNVTETSAGPTLYPSVGNWQQACNAHYLITNGQVRWAVQWSPEQILAGRRVEESRREAYYKEKYAKHDWFGRIWRWLKSLVR